MPSTYRNCRSVPRKLPDGPIKLYPVEVAGEACVVNGRRCYEVVIGQMEWSILLDVIVRQEAAAKKR